MKAVVTPDEMRAIDGSASAPLDVLVGRAAHAVARAAIRMLGGAYGRRVTVLAGAGNNGADGRVAAKLLSSRGVRVRVVDVSRATPVPDHVDGGDLLIDAVLGTGFTGTYVAPEVTSAGRSSALVLAVDIPSGLDALTGLVHPGCRVLPADTTVTFAAWKPGLLLGSGPDLAGRVDVADIGLTTDGVRAHVLDDVEARRRLPQRGPATHKWSCAVLVIGGSPGMTGAPRLAARAAARAGAGMVRVGVPGELLSGSEAVGVTLPAEHWGGIAVGALDRCRAVVLGPGIGPSRAASVGVRHVLAASIVPVVLDGDGLRVLAASPTQRIATSVDPRPDEYESEAMSPGRRAILQASARVAGTNVTTRGAWRGSGIRPIDRSLDVEAEPLSGRTPDTTILTPHDGEFAHITGRLPGPDRIAAARNLASSTRSVVLLKGPTTIVADSSGRVELVRSGDQRLATAGSGDVLSGIIAAFVAQGLAPFDAAAAGAYVHGASAMRGRARGLVAGDIADLIEAWWGDSPSRAARTERRG